MRREGPRIRPIIHWRVRSTNLAFSIKKTTCLVVRTILWRKMSEFNISVVFPSTVYIFLLFREGYIFSNANFVPFSVRTFCLTLSRGTKYRWMKYLSASGVENLLNDGARCIRRLTGRGKIATLSENDTYLQLVETFISPRRLVQIKFRLANNFDMTILETVIARPQFMKS